MGRWFGVVSLLIEEPLKSIREPVWHGVPDLRRQPLTKHVGHAVFGVLRLRQRMSNSSNSRPHGGFKIEVAERVNALPAAYLFGRINALMYQEATGGRRRDRPGDGQSARIRRRNLVIEKLVEAARDRENHGYSQSMGIMNLRREVAGKYFRKYGVRLDPESQIIVCLGSKEGFSHMCLALMGPGDTAIVPAPTFPAHVYGVTLAAGNAIALEVADRRDSCRTSRTPASICIPRPKLVIINYPHNPSAVTVEPEFSSKLVKLARRYGFMVISDMAYVDVAFDGYQPPSFLAAPGALDVGVEFTTMSKGYNMAGWRVGFACGNAEMVKALATIKAYYDYGMFQAIQVAAIVALRAHRCGGRGPGGDLRAAPRTCWWKACGGSAGISPPPRAGMFVWAKIPDAWTEQLDSSAVSP